MGSSSNDHPSETTLEEDIDIISRAIQVLDNFEWHHPNGLAVRAQASLTRLVEKLQEHRNE